MLSVVNFCNVNFAFQPAQSDKPKPRAGTQLPGVS